MAQNNELNSHVLMVNIGTLAATTTLPGPIFIRGCRLKQVSLINLAALAADDTNYVVVALQDFAGNTLASVSSKLTGGQGSLVAFQALAASAAALDLNMVAGLQTKIVVTKNGTGVPTLAQLQIDYHAR